MIVLGIESSCDETGVGIIELSPDGAMEIRADAVSYTHLTLPTKA